MSDNDDRTIESGVALSVTVEQQSLRRVRAEVEDTLEDIPVSVREPELDADLSVTVEQQSLRRARAEVEGTLEDIPVSVREPELDADRRVGADSARSRSAPGDGGATPATPATPTTPDVDVAVDDDGETGGLRPTQERRLKRRQFRLARSRTSDVAEIKEILLSMEGDLDGDGGSLLPDTDFLGDAAGAGALGGAAAALTAAATAHGKAAGALTAAAVALGAGGVVDTITDFFDDDEDLELDEDFLDDLEDLEIDADANVLFQPDELLIDADEIDIEADEVTIEEDEGFLDRLERFFEPPDIPEPPEFPFDDPPELPFEDPPDIPFIDDGDSVSVGPDPLPVTPAPLPLEPLDVSITVDVAATAAGDDTTTAATEEHDVQFRPLPTDDEQSGGQLVSDEVLGPGVGDAGADILPGGGFVRRFDEEITGSLMAGADKLTDTLGFGGDDDTVDHPLDLVTHPAAMTASDERPRISEMRAREPDPSLIAIGEGPGAPGTAEPPAVDVGVDVAQGVEQTVDVDQAIEGVVEQITVETTFDRMVDEVASEFEAALDGVASELREERERALNSLQRELQRDIQRSVRAN